MRTPSAFLRLLAALLALTLVAAACGDDDDADGDQSGNETTQDEGGGTDEGTTDQAGTDDGGSEPDGDAASGDLPDDFFSEDCQQAYDSFLAVQTKLGVAFTGETGDIEEARASINALADNAPGEIADAFETFAAEMGVFFDALADIDLTPGGQPTAEQMSQLIEISESVDEAALEGAGEEISAYFEDVCGQ
jgi:hypothetical protein